MPLKVFKKGETICTQKTSGNEMYIILSGRVKVYISINNEKIEIGDFKEDEFFGEMSLLLDEPRSATVEAFDETEVMIVDKNGLIKKIKEDPEFAWTALQTMARRLKIAHSVISRVEGEKKSHEIMHG
jgi:CRP-like cAMP-binding protein